jgi:hypothetical protein
MRKLKTGNRLGQACHKRFSEIPGLWHIFHKPMNYFITLFQLVPSLPQAEH